MDNKEKSRKQVYREIRQHQKARIKKARKKARIQEKAYKKVNPFWTFFVLLTSAWVQTAGFKVDKKGRPFFSVKFKTEGQPKAHLVKTACVWRDDKGSYRVLMNVSRSYWFRVYHENGSYEMKEATKHYSISFLLKNQKTVPVLINQKVMIGFLPIELDDMMNAIMDRALGLDIPVPQNTDDEPF
jgi:hypothetical protein